MDVGYPEESGNVNVGFSGSEFDMASPPKDPQSSYNRELLNPIFNSGLFGESGHG